MFFRNFYERLAISQLHLHNKNSLLTTNSVLLLGAGKRIGPYLVQYHHMFTVGKPTPRSLSVLRILVSDSYSMPKSVSNPRRADGETTLPL